MAGHRDLESRKEEKAIETATKMLESLPEPDQEQVVEHLREYIADLRDEMQSESQYEQSESELVSAARRARKEIQEGQSESMDHNRLCNPLPSLHMGNDTVTWFWIGGHDEYESFFS